MTLTYLLLAATATASAAPPAADSARSPQRVAWHIEARLDDQAEVLSGRLRLHYGNNARQRLDTLWFHLHLNAFRPNSAWARRELQFGLRRFQDLTADEHAFERVHAITVGGTAVAPVYPLAPDSTVMAVPLPRPLLPGDSVAVDMEWTARPSTLPRRQGRSGRHFDFAHWYPRIAVHDSAGWQVQPLLPQGEFFGEFGSYDVLLDVAADQVIGATGVPVSGDPGWEGAAARPGTHPLYRRDVFGAPAWVPLGLVSDDAAPGRKLVRWRAEDVHHFAWSTSPDYIYEGGEYRGTAVHVLYRPGDDDWADGVVVRRTEDALAFFDTIFGSFAWPQLTNVHRIEGGGTEFPMMMMNGSPSVGLILHETGHNYVQGILANNEWRDGWLDEGFVSFLTNWAHERAGRPVGWARDMEAIVQWERAGFSQPIGMPGAAFRDQQTYNAMTYTKAALVFRMLHWLMGEDAFLAGLRTFYADNRLQHVTEADLRAAMGAHHAGGVAWFFDQWIHTTGTLDYRIGELSARQAADGGWISRVEVIRDGDIFMPVDLRVGGVRQRLESRERRQVVEIRLSERPVEAALDPDRILIDVNPWNNMRRFPD
jgi:hypothetical protein